MKKLFFVFTFLSIFSLSRVNAVSESFEKMLTLMNIPLTNSMGYEINEEIYNKYNLIVYGKPQDVVKNQRWKDLENGKWINETTGKRGEYRILGFSLSGTVVNNEIFPDDYNSGKSPEEWNYIVIDDALSSWNNTEKYQTVEQYEYMLNHKLSRNGITYNLTARDIGLDKARLEAYATWKTSGSIFTLKKDVTGTLWGATFNVPPMAADAKLEAILDFENGTTYKMNEDEQTIEILFTYGAEVFNLTDYAKPEHIKTLSSEIEVEYQLFDKITGEKTTKLMKNNKIIIDRNDYPNVNKINVKVKNTSILETCFFAEAPLVDIKEAILEIVLNEDEDDFIPVEDVESFDPEAEQPKPVITDIKLYRLSGNDTVPLLVAKKTGEKFISAGQVLVVEAKILNSPTSVRFYIEGSSSIQKLDDLTKKFIIEEPKERGEKSLFTLSKLNNLYNLPTSMEKENKNTYTLQYVIPYNTKQTINSWGTLRNKTGNGLDINKNELFTRITKPYVIKIKASNSGGTTTESITLDVFERWDTIYNRDISEYVR